MGYYREHQRLRPVLEKARELNIGWNPAPEALFDPLPAGLNIWCTHDLMFGSAMYVVFLWLCTSATCVIIRV